MFVDELITELQIAYDNCKEISGKVNVMQGYLYGNKRKSHSVYVTAIDDSTVSDMETFCGETVINMPIQITVVSTQLRIQNNIENSINSTNYLANIAKSFMENFKCSNKKIKTCLRTSSSSVLPLDDSGADSYYKVIRYNITIQEQI